MTSTSSLHPAKRVLFVVLGAAVVLALLAADPTLLPFLFDVDLLIGLAIAGYSMTKAWLSGLRPNFFRDQADG